ncbi:unnamed protein product [Bursaphelenchus okinawaensis]|uniref:Ribosomal protein eL8/eL30/eS12/Gadd45 domain-containing protein n=1 Tax=Bursaphelenchus okinawaensis TaxID=465554 RepID=A0A811JSP6_9BILA|nr:unnamed protein product [Bursaphelenchus okinawaensis]CAG9080758.1 unnamed protein product [Bursaphelenchus okinawaensis]
MVKKEIKTEDESMDTSTVATTTIVPATDKDEYNNLVALCNEIAQPMAGRKLTKKIYKLLKSVGKDKNTVFVGLASVSKALRKGEKGIMVLAGNVFPIDMYSHIPGICEEKNIPYVYTPSREHLGLAMGYNRPCIVVMIKDTKASSEQVAELSAAFQELDSQF